MGFSFAHWVSAESAALGQSISSFATGLADNARFGLKTVVGAPQGIVHEISTGIISVSKVGAGAFGVAMARRDGSLLSFVRWTDGMDQTSFMAELQGAITVRALLRRRRRPST